MDAPSYVLDVLDDLDDEVLEDIYNLSREDIPHHLPRFLALSDRDLEEFYNLKREDGKKGTPLDAAVFRWRDSLCCYAAREDLPAGTLAGLRAYPTLDPAEYREVIGRLYSPEYPPDGVTEGRVPVHELPVGTRIKLVHHLPAGSRFDDLERLDIHHHFEFPGDPGNRAVVARDFAFVGSGPYAFVSIVIENGTTDDGQILRGTCFVDAEVYVRRCPRTASGVVLGKTR